MLGLAELVHRAEIQRRNRLQDLDDMSMAEYLRQRELEREAAETMEGR